MTKTINKNKNKQPSVSFSRRDMLKGAAVLAAGTAAAAMTPATLATAAQPASGTPWEAPLVNVVASPSKNVVELESGKVYGYSQDGVLAFMGMPYGASTGGKNRFMPAQKPEPWAGVRPALYWGPVAPQNFTSTLDAPRGGWRHPREAFMFRWEDGNDGEDCLVCNVWTSSINDNAKRPVMMWIHGGGYVFGSDQELRMYPGDNLVRRGDVVVVSVNHRLGVMGFSNLLEFGSQYRDSTNLGMRDLVLALEWVKTNIGNFGGDPNRVMIFGQSGGGGKVSTLMGMPEAEGLFHRAAIESGSELTERPMEAAARLTAAIVAELGLSKATIGRMHEIPYQRIVEAAVHAPQVAAAGGARLAVGGIGGWGPAVDGTHIPRSPWDPTGPSYSKNVPLIVGTTRNEFFNSVQMEDASVDHWTMAEVRQRLTGGGGTGFMRASFGKASAADAVLAVARKLFPNETPFGLYSVITATRTMRMNALEQARRKALQDGAPAYNYWFQRVAPILDGQARAHHCSELPYVFYQTETCSTMTGGGADARALGGVMADAWIHFARTGDPNHAGMPHWPAYDPATIPTMVFNDRTEAVNDPDGELRKAIADAAKA